MWRSIWAILPDIPEVRVVKVKAHLKFSHVMDGIISCNSWCGNAIADSWAMAACDLASRASPCESVHAQWIRAIAWYKRLVRMANAWVATRRHLHRALLLSAPHRRRPVRASTKRQCHMSFGATLNERGAVSAGREGQRRWRAGCRTSNAWRMRRWHGPISCPEIPRGDEGP